MTLNITCNWSGTMASASLPTLSFMFCTWFKHTQPMMLQLRMLQRLRHRQVLSFFWSWFYWWSTNREDCSLVGRPALIQQISVVVGAIAVVRGDYHLHLLNWSDCLTTWHSLRSQMRRVQMKAKTRREIIPRIWIHSTSLYLPLAGKDGVWGLSLPFCTLLLWLHHFKRGWG